MNIEHPRQINEPNPASQTQKKDNCNDNKCHFCNLCVVNVRTSSGLDSKTGLDSGPTSLNNKFVKSGRKNQPEFKREITIMEGLEE